MVNTVARVNKALKARGEVPRLRAGRGYYYFDGPAIGWPSSSVYVYRSSEMTVDEWVAEYNRLKNIANLYGE